MKKIATLLCSFLVTAISFSVYAQQMDEASMKAWMDYSTPGDMQKILAKSEGKWIGDITMWMAPGQPPMQQKGVLENKMILDGRYLQGKNTATMMGMPFEGWGLTGYDNSRKVFFNTWIDNMGTGIIYLEGTWNAEKKSIVFTGKQTDPMSGKEMDTREIFTIVDDNHNTMEMFVTMGGQEYKSMEIKFTRE